MISTDLSTEILKIAEELVKTDGYIELDALMQVLCWRLGLSGNDLGKAQRVAKTLLSERYVVCTRKNHVFFLPRKRKEKHRENHPSRHQ